MLGLLKAAFHPAVAHRVLRRPLTYELLARLGKNAYSRQNKRAQGIWFDFTSREMKAALRRENLVVWANAFFPFELLHALGVSPVHPETIAALAARLGLSRQAISCAEAGGYSSDICSFYRCATGLNMENLLPPPDLVISASYLCDGAVKFFHNIARYYGCDYFLLDVPYHDTENARKYLAGQLEELAGIIAARQGKRFDPDRLTGALELSNQAREYFSKTNELRRASPSPLSGDDAISYVLDMQFFGPGSRAGADFFKALYEEVKTNVDNGYGPVMPEKLRLLWLHYIRPYYPNEVMGYLEEAGASICFGEANYVYWEPLDVAKPFESLAAMVLANPSGGPLERRAGLALELAEKYNVDGVIHFSHWGCRQSCGGEYVIRDLMKKKGVPMLILDGDGADSRNYSKEQTRLRLEAFLEMLEAKK
ncbi:MAG: 2-hydroxyacyl-CoA dehydratase family protein [Chloroflexota bacterium]